MNFFEIIDHQVVISNPNPIKPSGKIAMKTWHPLHGWGAGIGTDSGYSFAQFLADAYHILGEMSDLSGMQQLIHHYYLKNGSADAPTVAGRIRKFLRNESKGGSE